MLSPKKREEQPKEIFIINDLGHWLLTTNLSGRGISGYVRGVKDLSQELNFFSFIKIWFSAGFQLFSLLVISSTGGAGHLSFGQYADRRETQIRFRVVGFVVQRFSALISFLFLGCYCLLVSLWPESKVPEENIKSKENQNGSREMNTSLGFLLSFFLFSYLLVG